MKPDTSHIKQIIVVSNTHWDREFRRSFEKTRHRLLDMLDITLDILEDQPEYHSFTMDGHSIMIDDYLEMRPERRMQVECVVRDGRLIIGPYYTLPEEFSIGHEPLVRNLLFGRRTVEKYGGTPGTVAYTPASWGQTGQLPQILAGFGLKHMMFYRGISHDEADAEWVWEGPDGTQVFASRFALYARYNWYYQVHRPITTGRVFEKDYQWGEFDEAPVRPADGLAGEDIGFELLDPARLYNKDRLRKAVEDMVEREGRHFTSEIFLAMNGHDISVAHPDEPQVVRDAAEAFRAKYEIRQGDLEEFWREFEKHADADSLPVLKGERRSYLKEGMWTYLFPNTISARTYLKQQDFATTNRLVYLAEPLAVLGMSCGMEAPARYLHRGWQFLLSNHTHDANGGCAPDEVCADMQYRYRKAGDIADIVAGDAIKHVVRNLDPADQPADALQLVVYNPLPFERDGIVQVDVEIPRKHGAQAVRLESDSQPEVARQAIDDEVSSSFVDSIWEVPRILDSNRVRFYAHLTGLPGLGYRTYRLIPEEEELRRNESLITGPDSMENEHLKVRVNADGTVDVECKPTGRQYRRINYLSDEGECGNAWQHQQPVYDRRYTSLGTPARISIAQDGPLVSVIRAELEFAVPVDYADGTGRSRDLVELPVRIEYRLEAGGKTLGVRLEVDNRARDHRLRVCFPTGLDTDHSIADSHFDVVERPIAVPESTGWVERAYGTHPLRSFAALSDGNDGFAVLPKGIFEYEAIDDAERALALTLIRGCRIKLMVSEEKQTELPDQGIQCPGPQVFEYALCPHPGDWRDACLLSRAAEEYTPLRAVEAGRGKGSLPHEAGLLTLDNALLHITCVKPAENGCAVVVRLFNPTAKIHEFSLRFGTRIAQAQRCKLDESPQEEVEHSGNALQDTVAPKQISSYLITLIPISEQ